jgi:hypothetical protein
LSIVRGVRLQPDLGDGRWADRRERRTSRLEVVATRDQAPRNWVCIGTTEADDADAAATGRRRDRNDGVGGGKQRNPCLVGG